nr:DUF2550 domain-containing protein [Nakamurella flavida]
MLALVVLVIVMVTVRRSRLARSGAVSVSWRFDVSRAGHGWVLGQGRFDGPNLLLYRSFSPLPMPARRLSRERLTLGERRCPAGTEADLLPVGSVIITCTDGGTPFELAVSEQVSTGVLSWLESLPPSSPAHRRGSLRRRD